MDNTFLRFLYKTIPGRMLLKFLTWPPLSFMVGLFLDSPLSVYLIDNFKKKNNITMDEVIVPANGFKSFNEFFCRKRRISKLNVEEGSVISPCDAFLTSIKLRGNDILDVKHTKFSVEDLLKDKKLAKEYKDGYALIFRLTPAHYHRYCFAIKGIITSKKRIDGLLHTVRPIATSSVPVYAQNSREYTVIKSSKYGKVVQMEVGAMMVGRINNHSKYSCGASVAAGSEKGFFEFGGSTIILLFKKDKIKLNEIYNETSVKYGCEIARACQ